MQSVEYSGLRRMETRFALVARASEEQRRELHERIGVKMQNVVHASISQSGINDSHSKIKGWQEHYEGSRGGYTAIRPASGVTGRDSPGAITNYLENGHKAGSKRVAGFYFYRMSKRSAVSIADFEINQFVNNLRRQIEGG